MNWVVSGNKNFYWKKGSFIKRQTGDTSSVNGWQRVVQQMTTSDIKRQRMTTGDNELQRVIQQVITNDNEWQRVVQRMKTNGSKWEEVKESNFGFRLKQNMQCITTTYSKVYISYKLGYR